MQRAALLKLLFPSRESSVSSVNLLAMPEDALNGKFRVTTPSVPISPSSKRAPLPWRPMGPMGHACPATH